MSFESTWAIEQTRYLIAHWGDMSASDIADDLGNKTKNAVIGKAYRLGLEKLQPAAWPKGRRRHKQRPLTAKEVVSRIMDKRISYGECP